ncbi:MAPK regulated corepressor interacting protein 2 [Drosophila ficusphila]|uniref:MAPK regulated corepressor interacting protein 2 n=1 Tax=Drosophila ficusphila TaxID=30025 RepID=UPI0007E70659|nr:MAPK regulated corepressor interacting protein 2 [Drosophila ficusphila]
MDRNNGRYPYNIRRQNSGHNPSHSYHHHHNNNSAAGASSSPGYNNHNAGNTPSVGVHNSNSIYSSATGQQQQSLPISQHDELIRYIREAWNKVYEQGPPVIYCNESDNQLKNFKPFDLEEYWGQRLVQNIHVTTTQAAGHQ